MTTPATTGAATTSADTWSEVAASWDRNRQGVEEMKEQLSRELLARLGLHDGDRVLELGSGTGEFARRLATEVAPSGRVIASDVAPGMVELLRGTLAGVGNVEVAQIDAVDTGLPDGSVDVVTSRMVLMLLDDPAAALREWRRVLTPSGRVGFAVWAGPQQNPWVSCVGIAAMMHGLVPGGPPTGPGGMFSMADPAEVERTVLAAGFSDAVVSEVPTVSRFASTDDHFDTVSSLAGPLSIALAAAPAEVRDAVRSTAAGLAEAHRTPDGLVLAGRALLCTAVAAPG